MSLGIFRVMTMALSGYTTRVIRGTLVMMMMTFTLTLDARPGGDLEFDSSGGVDPWFLDESGTPRYSYDHVIESEQSYTERGDPEVDDEWYAPEGGDSEVVEPWPSGFDGDILPDGIGRDGLLRDPAYEDYWWDGDPYYPVYDENGYLEE